MKFNAYIEKTYKDGWHWNVNNGEVWASGFANSKRAAKRKVKNAAERIKYEQSPIAERWEFEL
jgi:predicted nuclease of restriction endonuclease-like (RecB) superfamily